MEDERNDIQLAAGDRGMRPAWPMSPEKQRLFNSPEAHQFEKQTVARYDNVNIVRSKCEDDVIPNVPSAFPNPEQSIPMPELQDHEYH